jgi:hypothetical protein
VPLMRHPTLPADQIIEAQDIQVHHYQASGWEVIPDDDPPGDGPPESPAESPEETTEAPADAGASALPDKADDTGTPRRRRAATKPEPEEA